MKNEVQFLSGYGIQLQTRLLEVYTDAQPWKQDSLYPLTYEQAVMMLCPLNQYSF